MITSFQIQNFRSILDLTLDFTFAEGKAPNGYKDAEVMPFFEKGGKRILPCTAFFGANASGKTNILKAFKALDQMVLAGRKPKYIYEPNLLNPKYTGTIFCLEFVHKDILFEYRVCFNAQEITYESLKKDGQSLYFVTDCSGTFPTKITTAHYDAARLNEIVRTECSDGEGKQTRLFLNRIGHSYAGLNLDLTAAYKFFEKQIPIFDNQTTIALDESVKFLAMAMDSDHEAALLEITEVVRRLDIDIQEINITDYPHGIAKDEIKKGNSADNEEIIIPKVPIINSTRLDITGNPVHLNFNKHESAGTQRLAGLVGLILYSLKVGGVFVVDELDCSLHALLFREIISLYKKRRHNTNAAQLIFTTHNTDVLDDSVLRLSEIALVRKTVANGTIVRRLAEFKKEGEDLRNVHNFRKQYLAGFYSAIPHPALWLSMSTRRHIIVCEGESEWTYLRRLQGFLDDQPLEENQFQPPLMFIAPESAIAKNGEYKVLVKRYKEMRKLNKRSSIEIWADFDLYHRNDNNCADNYQNKVSGLPHFLFSYHNFEDFYSLHHDGEKLQAWLDYGSQSGRHHFTNPLHSVDYEPEIKRIFPDYAKGGLPVDFVSWDSLKNLKANLHLQPNNSNPHQLTGIRSFAEFLIKEIESAYPGKLD